MFQPDGWHMVELWEKSSVRYGWLQGMWNMLQGQQSLDFFCTDGKWYYVLTSRILSLFIFTGKRPIRGVIDSFDTNCIYVNHA